VHSVHIAAEPAQVFDYFTRPEAIVRWMGDYAVLDPRPDGEFTLDINGVPVRGRYLEVEPPRRLVISWGHAGSERLPPGASTVEITLTPEGEGTTVLVVHRDLPELEARQHALGWRHFLERLIVAGAAGDPGADPWAAMRYELEFEDTFDGDALNLRRWIPHYLPHWSSRERSAARYAIGGGCLRLLITADQEPWCPELDGDIRVSSLQTGVFAGPVGSIVGQHRFDPDAVVREAQRNTRLYTPQYGRIELRAKAPDDPRAMAALWMIGYEDEPERSAEICVCEIFGRDVSPTHATVGIGVHPFGDARIVDDFSAVRLRIDVREFHLYAAEWTPERVAFFVDGERLKTVGQSLAYPMQLMLGIYEFPGEAPRPAAEYPKEFVVDYVRGYRLAA
jgi:uncharacterized protein YndB with AHSA1/START domain